MFQRISGIYLWIALFLASFLMDARVIGTVGLLVAGSIHLALLVAAIWTSGARKTEEGRVREHPAFLPGVLLVSGPIVLFWGASTGEPTATSPGNFLFNATGLLVGVLILLLGFAILSARLREAGENLFSVLGFTGFLLGVGLFAANIAFRFAAVASGAAGAYARLEDVAALPNYLAGLPPDPSPLLILMAWMDVVLVAYVLLSYLAMAAFGIALIRAGWLGKAGGSVLAALGLAFVGSVVAGLSTGSPFGVGLAFFLSIPFMSTVLPYFLGVALVAARQMSSSARRATTATTTGRSSRRRAAVSPGRTSSS